jgi:hypothetical protein
MEDLRLGKTLPLLHSFQRNAVHIAIIPVVARERLSPGQPIGLVGAEDDFTTVGPSSAPIGIVDPFLTAPVYQGEQFWMWLNPESVTNFKQHWSHPAFDKPKRDWSKVDATTDEEIAEDVKNNSDLAPILSAIELIPYDTGQPEYTAKDIQDISDQLETLHDSWWRNAMSKNDNKNLICSSEWLKVFASRAGISYEELIAGAKNFIENGQYMIDGIKWKGFEVPDEFWDHYGIITTRFIPLADRGNFFSYSEII